MSSFLAGFTTSTFTCSWLLIFLAHYPEWRLRCQEEVDQVVEKHRKYTEQTSTEILSGLSLQQWETDFPVIAGCVKETLRLQLPGTMFRKNDSNSDIPIGNTGEVIPAGAYALYVVADTHRDPNLYKDPQSFNPGRHIDTDAYRDRGPHSYLGFGSGRHVCRKWAYNDRAIDGSSERG
jgi:cytochrome P450